MSSSPQLETISTGDHAKMMNGRCLPDGRISCFTSDDTLCRAIHTQKIHKEAQERWGEEQEKLEKKNEGRGL